MSTVRQHTNQADYEADCLTCRDWPGSDVANTRAAHVRWARNHAGANPGHEVHMEAHRVTVFKREEDTNGE